MHCNLPLVFFLTTSLTNCCVIRCCLSFWNYYHGKAPHFTNVKYYSRSNWWGQGFQNKTRKWRLCSISMRRSKFQQICYLVQIFSLILCTRWSITISLTLPSWSWRRKIWRGRCQGTCTRSHVLIFWMVNVVALHQVEERPVCPSWIIRMDMSEPKTPQQTQLGGGPQSLQLALQFSGQVCAWLSVASKLKPYDQVADDSPRIGQQVNQIAAFEPGVEEVLK